jgi:hypothetical protein
MVIRFYKILIIILRAVGIAPQSAARSVRWGHHGLPSQRARAVHAAKIKLLRRAAASRANMYIYYSNYRYFKI